jgi:ribokinase
MLHVLGNACRDITFRVEILPRPGETLNARITYGGLGGKGLNQAIAACAEMDVRLIAAVGNDSAASLIRDTLRAERIATDTLIDLPGETGRRLHAIPSQPELADEKISLHVPPRAGRR